MGDPKILVLEDDRMVQGIFRRMLSGGPEDFEIVGSVAEAIRFILLDAPDLLVTDMNLPDGTGDEVIRFLRQIKPEARIIVMSGTVTPDAYLTPDESPVVSAFMEKPFELEKMKKVIRQTLRRNI